MNIKNSILRDLVKAEQLHLRLTEFARHVRVGGSKNVKKTVTVPVWILVYHCVEVPDKVRKYYGRTIIKQARRYQFLKTKHNYEY